MKKILITGACGQLGSELTAELRSIHGGKNVIASDITGPNNQIGSGPYEKIDVMDRDRLEQVIEKYKVSTVYHLAALLSAKAEQNFEFAWKLNIDGLLNVLKITKERALEKVFWPSSIAVFGPDARKNKTPQDSACNPATVYGISKLAGEQWCSYFHRKFDVDVRSIRFPGLIGYKTLPGGGTTDYAVDIYHKALDGKPFNCFLKKDTKLPMMYMHDAVKATVELMDADADRISVRTSYNVSAISFSPEEIAASIKKQIPAFRIDYNPDYRQQIAGSWPDSIDDSVARKDWGWQPDFDLERMTGYMLSQVPEFWKEGEKVE